VRYIVHKIFKPDMLYCSGLSASGAKIPFVMMRTIFTDDGWHIPNLTKNHHIYT
jgi:hypothetical protein